jgi:hypothetical protein
VFPSPQKILLFFLLPQFQNILWCCQVAQQSSMSFVCLDRLCWPLAMADHTTMRISKIFSSISSSGIIWSRPSAALATESMTSLTWLWSGPVNLGGGRHVSQCYECLIVEKVYVAQDCASNSINLGSYGS